MAVETMREETRLHVAESKISWGAIFGGAVAALGIWILLTTFGMALGFSTVNPERVSSLHASGIFTGIWSLISPLVALFAGGVVAGRSAGATTRLGGATHGVVMWGLTTLAGVYLVTSLLGMVARGAVDVGKAAVQAGGAAVSQAASGMGLNADDALAPINQRLQAEGKPAVTADQLKAAVQQVVQGAAQTGKVDREQLVSAIAQQTNLSRADAEEVAGRVEGQLSSAKDTAGQVGERVQTGALQAVDTTGKALWGVFGALLLGMVSAVLGATLGVSRRHDSLIRERSVVRRPGEVAP